MERTYLFYDIETTGLNKAFDQVLQFAAIRTDQELNELERHEILVKPNADCMISPQALITHRISLQKLMDEGINELDAISSIHNLLNTPGTMSVGYNTMGFDDEFLRFSFFRNLLPPYSHQYANYCSRFDIFPITIAYYLFNKDSLVWPELDEKVSLKLEDLNNTNHFTEGNAHDAMIDVITTLKLASKLKESSDMWLYLLQSFDKDVDHQRIAKLTSAFSIQHHQFKQAIMLNSKFGNKNSFQSFVLNLGRHNHYKNQSIWMRLDANDLSETTLDNIDEKTWTVSKKPGDESILLPCIDRFLIYINDERRTLVDKNLSWIQENIPLFREICRYHLEYTYPKIPNVDADAALYQMGFLLPHETQLCQNFHLAFPEERVALIKQFSNPILREQAIRVIGRNSPELLTENLKAEFENYLSMIKSNDNELATVDYRGGKRLTPSECLHEIESLLEKGALDEQQKQLLNELKQYVITTFDVKTVTATGE